MKWLTVLRAIGIAGKVRRKLVTFHSRYQGKSGYFFQK